MKQLKKVSTALLLIFSIMAGTNVHAQQSSETVNGNVLKWNPVSLAFSTLNISYERRLNQKLTLQGTVTLTGKSTDAGLNSGNGYYGVGQTSAYGLVVDLRYYATYQTMQAPQGFYIGPFIRYMSMSFSDDSTAGSGSRISIGGTLGYQIILSNVFTIDMFGGPAYEIVSGSLSKSAFETNNYNIYGNQTTSRIGVNKLMSNFDPLLPGVGSSIGFRCGITLGVAF